MKKLLYTCIAFMSSFYSWIVEAATRDVPESASLENDILNIWWVTWPSNVDVSGEGTEIVSSFFIGLQDTILSFMFVISIWVFLFVGFRLAVARGNPEEFKKAWMQFLYAIIGIAIVSLSYWVVTLVQGLNI